MSQRRFKNWLRGYLEYTKYLEAPDTFHFWAGVSAIAGALRGKVWFDMGYFKWKPNFFIVYVAPPGVVAKSTTIGTVMPMLREVPGISFGPDSGTWQGITQAFMEATQTFDLGDGVLYKDSSITVAISELGTLLDPKNREMVDVLVDLWDGRVQPWKRRTKGEGESEIHNPFFNMIGCTTPGWMSENFPEYAIQGGFTSRTIFLYADRKRHFEAYPRRRLDIDTDVAKLKPLLVHDLTEIAQIAGPYEMTEDAYEWGETWYKEHWVRPVVEADKMAGYKARKQTHVHKLAMVLAAAQRNERVITKDDLIVADQFITALEASMPEVFNAVSDTKEIKCAALIVRTVQRSGPTPRMAVWRQLFSLMSYNEFVQGLLGAVAAGKIKEVNSGGDIILVPLETPVPSSDMQEPKLAPSEGPESEALRPAPVASGSPEQPSV